MCTSVQALTHVHLVLKATLSAVRAAKASATVGKEFPGHRSVRNCFVNVCTQAHMEIDISAVCNESCLYLELLSHLSRFAVKPVSIPLPYPTAHYCLLGWRKLTALQQCQSAVLKPVDFPFTALPA